MKVTGFLPDGHSEIRRGTPARTISPDPAVVFGVGADPEPLHTFGYRHAEGSVMKADANAYVLSLLDLLEVQRRVGGVCL